MTKPSTTDDRVLIAHGDAALAACRTVLQQVVAADAGRRTPCSEFTVTDLADHLARSMVLLAGCAGAEVTEQAAGTTLDGRIAPLAATALSAWQARGFAGEVPLGSRTLPAVQVFSIVLLELVIHGWDLARALDPDAEFAVAADVVAHLWQQAPALIVPQARGRAFAAEVEIDADAPLLARLIAFTGRRP